MRRLLLSVFGAAALLFPLDLAAHDRYVAPRPIVRVNSYSYGYRAYPGFRRRHGCHRHRRFFRHRTYYRNPRFGPVIIVPRRY